MKRGAGGRPPRWLRWVLGRLLPRAEREDVLREMDDLWGMRVRSNGAGTGWYTRQVLGFVVRLRGRGAGWAGSGSVAAALNRDVRLGLRALSRRPGYTVAAVLTLGAGLGGVATVYVAANWVLLRPVPGVASPDDLVTVRMEAEGGGGYAYSISAPDLATLAGGVPALEALAGSARREVHLEVPRGGARRIEAGFVTEAWGEVLGLRAVLGSAVPGDGVVISHRLWREVWRGSVEALGSRVLVNGHPLTVEGVAPSGFRGPELPGGTDVWLAAALLPRVVPDVPGDVLDRRGETLFALLVGRLTPGVTPVGAEAQLQAGIERIRSSYGEHSFATLFTPRVWPGVGLSPRVRAGVERTLLLLGGTAVLLLLLAMANAANLSLAHAVARSGSLAVHRALGASRAAVARRVLVEHGLLGVACGGVGLAVTVLGMRVFRGTSLSSLGASLEGMRLDGRVLLFTTSVALASALLVGVIPAVTAGRGRLLTGLQGRRHGGRMVSRLQGGLVVVQVALSAVLLIGAGLMVHTILNLRAEELGFEPEHAVRFSIDPMLQGYGIDETRAIMAELREALAREPGVRDVGFTSPELVSGSYLTAPLRRAGTEGDDDLLIGAQFSVTPGFLAAAGIRLLAGRELRPGDEALVGPDRPVVVGRAVAEALLPALPPEDVPGRRLRLVRAEVTVVGVVEDPRVTGILDARTPAAVFLPWGTGLTDGPVSGWVRTRPGTTVSPAAIRMRVASSRPELPVFGLRTVREQVDRLVTEQRVVTRLALTLAALGLGLAGIGLQGLLSYTVAGRRREIGIRMALGASAGTVVRSMVRDGLTLTALGALAGCGGGLALGRVIEARLFGVEPLDPATYAIAAVVLVMLAALAAAAPARRAASIPPREALTAE